MASQTAVMLAASTSEQAWPFFLVVVALELILSALCLGDGTVGGGQNRCGGEGPPIWPTSKGGKNEKSKTEEFSDFESSKATNRSIRHVLSQDPAKSKHTRLRGGHKVVLRFHQNCI